MERRRLKVLCPIKNEKSDKTYWLKVGSAFPNRDGSTNIFLDALPQNGRLQLRELDESDLAPRPRAGADAGGGDLPF